MRKLPVLLLLFIHSFLYCDDISTPEIEYKIQSTSKGFFNISIIYDEKNHIALFDNGIDENSRIFINDSGTTISLRDIKPSSIKTLNGGLEIKWILNGTVITESFIKENDGFLYSISYINSTKELRNVSVSLLYDTYLGEKGKKHFIIDNFKTIKHENNYLNQNIPKSIKSVNNDGFGIEYSFNEKNYSLPNQVILGNWDRLSNSKNKLYTPTNGGSFSYGYYSINDSGIGIVYPTVGILPNKELLYSFKLNIIYPKSDISEVKPKANTTDSIEEVIEDVDIKSNINPTDTIQDVTEDEEIELKDDNDENNIKTSDTSEEELNKMLEYIQKKKRGEDVSEYDFDEDYIIMKLKEINE